MSAADLRESVHIVTGDDPLLLDQRCVSASGLRLPVLVLPEATVIGPLYDDSDGPCLACFDYRSRLRTDAPHLTEPAVKLSAGVPGIDTDILTSLALRSWKEQLPPSSELPWRQITVIDRDGIHNHRLWRSVGCYRGHRDCESTKTSPDGLDLNELRSDRFETDADRRSFVNALVDPLFGPVLGIGRITDAASAMSAAVLPQSRNVGYGRGARYAQADFVAVMEAWERMCGHPFAHNRLLPDAALPSGAIKFGTPELGGYHTEQLSSPYCRVDPDAPAEWVAAHTLDGARSAFLPAEVAFYNYQPRQGTDYHLARRSAQQQDSNHQSRLVRYDESSSGTALGATYDEAAAHSLFEVLERDAFLRFWYGAATCPRLALDQSDEESALLIERIASDGFRCELIELPGPTSLPVVAAFAFQQQGRFPFVLCAAGSGIHCSAAVRSALWELVNLTAAPRPSTAKQVAERLPDRWSLRSIEDHVDYYALPSNGIKVLAKCSGPTVPIREGRDLRDLTPAASRGTAADVVAALTTELVAADLGPPHFVDQTNLELRDQGLYATKCVVPGALSMTFGTAHQRVRGLATLAAIGREDLLTSSAQLDPHPFP